MFYAIASARSALCHERARCCRDCAAYAFFATLICRCAVAVAMSPPAAYWRYSMPLCIHADSHAFRRRCCLRAMPSASDAAIALMRRRAIARLRQ